MDVIPVLARWNKEGNNGKKKKDRVTRYLTLVLGLIQGGSLTYAFDKGYGILTNPTIWTYAYVVIIMITGSMFAMWLGDQITEKGVGNGTSLLIFTGIVANLPQQFIASYNAMVSWKSTQAAITSTLWYICLLLFMLLLSYLLSLLKIVFVRFQSSMQQTIHRQLCVQRKVQTYH